jgi:hypothetical protein
MSEAMPNYFILATINQAADDRVQGFMEIEDYKYKRLDDFDGWGVGRATDVGPAGAVEIRVVPREKCVSPPIDLYDFSIPLISARFKSALDKVGVDNIHYVPATLRNSKTKEGYDYFAFNLMGLVAGADRGSSNMSSFDGDFIGDTQINDLVIDESKCRGLLMFRLAEKFSVIMVHRKVKDVIESQGIDTLTFMDPKDFMAL